MAQIVISDVSFGEADSTTVDVTHVVAAGDGLIVLVTLETVDGSKEVSGVNWDEGGGDEVALNFITDFDPTHGKLRMEAWGIATATNPVAKTATVRVTVAQAQKTGVYCISYSNPDLSTQTDGADTDEGTDNGGSVSVVSGADDLALAVAGYLSTASNFTPTGDSVEEQEDTVQSTYDTGLFSADVDGTATLSWTHGGSSADNSTLGINLRAASADLPDGKQEAQPTHIPRLVRNIVLLTTVVNLLQSTLAPLPVGAQTFEVPAPAHVKALTHIQSRPFFYDAIEPIPDGKQIYKIPPPANIIAKRWTQEKPFFYRDETVCSLLQEDTFRILQENDFRILLEQCVIDPFRQNDWSNPQPKPAPALTHIQPRPSFFTEPIVSIPGKQIYDNPVIPVKRHKVILSPYTLEVTVDERFGSKFYVDYRRLIKPALTWIDNSLALANVPSDVIPEGKQTYDNPTLPIKPALTWIQTGLEEIEKIPGIPEAFPNPKPIPPPAITHLQPRPFFYDDIEPIPDGNQIFDLPVLSIKPALTWIQERPQFFQDTKIESQTEWPNPLIGGKNQVGFIQRSIISEVLQLPFTPEAFPNPEPKPAPALTWIQARPQFFEDEKIERQTEFPNPIIGRTNFHSGWINTQQIPVPEFNPFIPVDYPNPGLPKQQTITWIQTRPIFAVDVTLPGKQVFDNPLIGKANQVSWINTQQLVEVANPFIPVIFNNPLIGAPQTITWLQERKQFFVDIRIQSTQIFDNPVLAIKPAITWTQDITSREIPSIPIRQTEWPIPVLKIIEALTWINTTQPDILSGKPFKQTEWPIFLPYKPVIHNLTYIRQSILVPTTIGREICLLSDAQEYNLESNAEIYNLLSNAQIYDLESDGEQCR